MYRFFWFACNYCARKEKKIICIVLKSVYTGLAQVLAETYHARTIVPDHRGIIWERQYSKQKYKKNKDLRHPKTSLQQKQTDL